VQDLLDLVERLPPEVLGAEHLGFGLLDEFADRPDIGVLQAVVRPHRQLELLDALVEILVRGPRPRLICLCFLRLIRGIVDIDEDVQVIANQLRSQRHGIARRDRAVRPDIDRQLVVVGGLAEARGLHQVVHLLHGRVHRVHRDPADAQVLVEVLVRRDVSPPALQAQLHVELAAVRHRRDVRLGLEDLDVCVALDVLGPHDARLVHAQIQRLGVVDVQLQRNLLEVEDDIGRVFDDARDGRKLVQHAVDLHRGDRRSLDGRQQHAPKRVADGRAEAAFKRLGVEPPEPVGEGVALEVETLGTLKTFPEHGYFLSPTGRQFRPPDLHVDPPASRCRSVKLRAVGWLDHEGHDDHEKISCPSCAWWFPYFEYNSTISCSCTGRLIC
jgi:hypothetical protein